jgi:hypothetical protein
MYLNLYIIFSVKKFLNMWAENNSNSEIAGQLNCKVDQEIKRAPRRSFYRSDTVN